MLSAFRCSEIDDCPVCLSSGGVVTDVDDAFAATIAASSRRATTRDLVEKVTKTENKTNASNRI